MTSDPNVPAGEPETAASDPDTSAGAGTPEAQADDRTSVQREITRRRVLGGLGLGSLSLMLGANSPAAAAPPPAQPTAAPRPKRPRVGDASGPVQPGPYSMQASCELSEDYFLTSDVIVGTDDRVVPFVNPKNNNAVEAIVFAGGQLSHLYRDASASSGWNFETIGSAGLFSEVTDFAVAASTSDVYLLMIGVPGSANDNPGQDPAWLITLSGPNTWNGVLTASREDLQWTPSGTISVKGGIDPSGVCYFYTSLVDGDATYLLGWVVTQNFGSYGTTLDFQQYKTLDNSDRSNPRTLEDYIIVFDNSFKAPVGYALVLTSDGSLSVYPQLPYTDQYTDSFSPDPLDNAGAQNVAALLWAWATPGSTTGQPGYAVQQNTGTALVDENGNYNQLWDSNVLTQDQATVWLQDGLYTVNVLDGDGTVNMIQETSNSGNGTWASALPLTKIPEGFASIYGVPTDPNEATLFAVGADETLSVLSLGPAGWTQTQVRQDGAQLQSIDSYRVRASVLDANGAGVGLARVQVSSDRPVGFWQPAGNTIVTPAAPVTMAVDAGGRLTFSIPAEEIDAAVLTMQALDANGNPSGTAFTVTPDTDVRDFLNGAGSLLDIGAMSATTLLAAKNSTGGPLLTALTNLPSDQQTAVATAVAGAFNQLITVGSTAAPSGSATTQAMLIDMSQATPVVQTSTNPNAFSVATAGHTLQLSFTHLFDSIGHGLRHAALSLEKTVVRWVDDAKNWVVDLAVKIGDAIVNFTDLVITDIKDAFHVIGGFFHALGANIKDAMAWLRHNVLELIKDTDTNAKIIQSWFDPFFNVLTNGINTIEIDAETFFVNLENQASGAITQLAALVEDAEFGSSAPLPPPTADTGSHDADLLFKTGEDVISFMRHSPGNWLLDKVQSFLPEAPADGGPDFSDFDAALEKVIQDLFTDIGDAINVVEDIGNTLWDAVQPFLTDNGTFSQTSMGKFFTSLDALVVDGLKLVEAVLQTFLDAIEAAVAGLKDVLDYQFQAVPFMTDLFELAGIDTTLSIARIISLIAAFPTTLINQIIGGGSLFPTDNTPPASVVAGKAPAGAQRRNTLGSGSTRVDGWGVGLNWMSSCIQAIWSFGDLSLDVGAFDKDNGPNFAPPFKGNALTTSIDIICPVLITMMQFPSPTDANNCTQPFWAGINDKGDRTDLIPWMLATSFVPPLAGIFSAIASAKGWPMAPGVSDYGLPIICTMSGVSNTVLSSIYGKAQNVSVASITFGVLSNISYDIAPLGFPALNKAFENVPAAGKLVADTLANFGTSAAMSDQAIIGIGKPLAHRIPL